MLQTCLPSLFFYMTQSPEFLYCVARRMRSPESAVCCSCFGLDLFRNCAICAAKMKAATVFVSVLLMYGNAKKFEESRGKCETGGKPTCGHYTSCNAMQCFKLFNSEGERCGVWRPPNRRGYICREVTWGLKGEPARQQDGGVVNNGKKYRLEVFGCNALKDVWAQEGDARVCYDAYYVGGATPTRVKCDAWQNVDTGESKCHYEGLPSDCQLFQDVGNPANHVCYNKQAQHFCEVMLNQVSGVYQCGYAIPSA
eukprot:Skav202814  [mRNA]  locus=scaffold326:1173859:1174620:+ [translate_table: standard]